MRSFATRFYQPDKVTLYLDGEVPYGVEQKIAQMVANQVAKAAESSIYSTSRQFEPATDDQRILYRQARVPGPELWL